jgi:hypothetical protein
MCVRETRVLLGSDKNWGGLWNERAYLDVIYRHVAVLGDDMHA